ncbi:MAG: hypothetical protein JNL80_13510 [Phycisphaerae bacterium]|nr:hypothetical protein [Phycisphaerae bacterium]
MTDFHAFRIATTLPCRRCRYDLRGLTADTRCPECGLEVLETVAARVDPELALLPPLARPRWAGTSLLMVTLALACAAIGTSISAAALILSKLPRVGWHSSLIQFFPPTAPDRLELVSPVALIVACSAAVVLLLTCGVTGKQRLFLPIGLGVWAFAAWFQPELVHLALTGLIAIGTLMGLGPIVSHLGQRSRAYRHAAHAQQAIGPLMASIAIGVGAVLLGHSTGAVLGADAVHFFKLIATVCLAMTNVGFVYLAVNGVWIWRSLWGWQPLLERMLVNRVGTEIGASSGP